MLKFALTYSKPWKAVKTAAKIIVKTKPKMASTLLPAVIAWWEYVIVAPEQSKINVLTNGTSKALNVSIPLGGQMFPISIVGAILAAKNAQKKRKRT
jgi:hypothetical protein